MTIPMRRHPLPPADSRAALREHYAGLMMQSLVMQPLKAHSPGYADTARQAVKMADALIEELEAPRK